MLLTLSAYGDIPIVFVLATAAYFGVFGEIYSLFPATSGDTFGAKFATTNNGMLYTAKGTASLLVPLASIAAAHYGWQAVFVIAVGLNATAALLALFVIKPMRRAFILGDEAAPVDVIARTVGTLPFESKRGELRVSLSFLSPKHWYTKYKRTA
jgi:OFA family oxalate/formate antiporter-like MFS transporter